MAARFRIDADQVGGKVFVNDQDVTETVAAASLHVAPGQPTTLTVHTIAEGTLEGEGVVQVVHEVPCDETACITAFLDSMLANSEGVYLDAMGLHDLSHDLTKAVITVLRHYATGEGF